MKWLRVWVNNPYVKNGDPEWFEDRIISFWAKTHRINGDPGVMLIDIDRLKIVRETTGPIMLFFIREDLLKEVF